MGRPPSGRRSHLAGMDLFRFDDALLIAEISSFRQALAEERAGNVDLEWDTW